MERSGLGADGFVPAGIPGSVRIPEQGVQGASRQAPRGRRQASLSMVATLMAVGSTFPFLRTAIGVGPVSLERDAHCRVRYASPPRSRAANGIVSDKHR